MPAIERWAARTGPARLGHPRLPRHIWHMSDFKSHTAKVPTTATPAPDSVKPKADRNTKPKNSEADGKVPEIGGPSGPEPTRYGDWERKGIVRDF